LQETSQPFAFRVCQHLCGHALFDDLATIDEHEMVPHITCELHLMGRDLSTAEKNGITAVE